MKFGALLEGRHWFDTGCNTTIDEVLCPVCEFL